MGHDLHELLQSIPKGKEILSTLDAPTGHRYVAVKCGLDPLGPRGEAHRIRIYRQSNPRAPWMEIPLQLNLKSRILYGVVASWPPEHLESLKWEADQLVIKCRDPWVPYEKPILPFRFDEESYWCAKYREASKRWSIERVGYVEYGESRQ